MKSGIFIILICITVSCGQTKKEDETLEQEQTIKQEPTVVIEQPKQEDLMSIEKGSITTIADGIDVQRVNLWSSTGSDRVTTSHLTNGEKIKILKDEDPYYLIETTNGDGRRGYCMKGFVIKNK